MAEKTIAALSEDLVTSLRRGREAIIGRGGTIGTTAGFADFPSAIYNIPADNAITTDVHNAEAQAVAVPEGTYDYAYLAEFGGITYRDTENNRLYNVGLSGLQVTRESNGEVISTVGVPQEILDLEGYGEGINISNYNKVDLVNNKYIRVIKTFVFDGSFGDNGTDNEGWKAIASGKNNYFGIEIGDAGEYVTNAVVCSHFDYAYLASGNETVGITVSERSVFGGKCGIFVRPENVEQYTTAAVFKRDFLAKNPITVMVATVKPIKEIDLHVDMNPLFKVESNTTVDLYPSVDLSPEEGKDMPVKIIFQTRTQ